MEPLHIVGVVAIVLFAGASFFFALAETALFALGMWRARQIVGKTPNRGKQVFQLVKHPREALATIVLVSTLCNGIVVVLGLWLGAAVGWPLGWTLLVIFLVILLVCEVTPKTLAVRMPEYWALRVAGPMQFFVRLTRPVREVAQSLNAWLLKKLTPRSVKPHVSMTDEDYEELIEMAYQQGTLEHAEKEIIYELVNLDQSTAGDVMNPRTQIDGLPISMSREEMEEAARRLQHRRLVLYNENLDNIVGILNTRTLLLFPGVDIDEAIELPSFVPESMNLLQLYLSLQRQKRRVTIVLDEFGQTAGFLTLEDIIEEMVGDIRREDEPEEREITRLGRGRWMVKGELRIDDFREEYPSLEEAPEVDTMGGLLTRGLEVIPREGESFEIDGLRLTAIEVDERRVYTILVEETKN